MTGDSEGRGSSLFVLALAKAGGDLHGAENSELRPPHPPLSIFGKDHFCRCFLWGLGEVSYLSSSPYGGVRGWISPLVLPLLRAGGGLCGAEELRPPRPCFQLLCDGGVGLCPASSSVEMKAQVNCVHFPLLGTARGEDHLCLCSPWRRLEEISMEQRTLS